jgi:hypothetical protein
MNDLLKFMLSSLLALVLITVAYTLLVARTRDVKKNTGAVPVSASQSAFLPPR